MPLQYEHDAEARVTLLKVVSVHGFAWSEYTIRDKGDIRTVQLKAVRPNAEGYAHFDQLRSDLLIALDEHGYELAVFQPQDTEGAANLTLIAKRDLNGQQLRIEGA